ncbi:hypothetical protein KC356_g5345 [Hortaea werneckii]|nr:hypothetical protein KC356_g5345 [Hortaea werneckii]
MVAELALYWILYEHGINGTLYLPRAQSALHQWKREWARLFDQPRHQFLLMSYSFGQLLMYEQSLSSKSAAVRQSLLSEMLRLSSGIMQLAIDTADARTKHLTDHVYHMIAFAAVTALRLMSKYGENLRVGRDFRQMESLVCEVIEWLDSIGPSSHTGHIMSDVIKATQRKLGARFSSSTQASPPALQVEADNFVVPDLFAANTAEFDWDSIIPDWPSLESFDGPTRDGNFV